MTILNLQQKLVAVLGFGQEGRATAEYLLKHGIMPVLFDEKPWTSWPESDQAYIKGLGVNFIFGPDCFAELAGFDIAFRSPGINPKRLPTKNLQITSQTKYFFENCPAKIIGVTGTKGKGTTSALAHEMLKAAGKNSYLTGNIGFEQPFEILDNLKPEDWVVYELSSFQLQDLKQSPHIGVVLMVTEEHLDYHKDAAEYVEAKSNIVKYQSADDVAIINADFDNSRNIGGLGRGKKIYFSRKQKVEQGMYAENGMLVARIGENNFQIPTSRLPLRGAHNLDNVMAASLAAACAGCSVDSIEQTANTFKGLEHRLEFVAEKNGVKYYNDSFSTTPETAIAAIHSFIEPEIIILGGSSKNSNFKDLAKTLVNKGNVKALVLLGEEAANIERALTEAGQFRGKILKGAGSMDEVFEQIKTVVEPGDVVVLSPACASFDMFKNYKDRGEQFKKSVQNLK